MAPDARLVHRAKELRTSFFWLCWFLLFGATPLAVYVSHPGRPLTPLLMSLILGVPSFLYSLALMGKSRAIFIDPSRQRLVQVIGFFHRRQSEEYPYRHVEAIDIVEDPNGASESDSGDPAVAVCLADGPTFILPVPDWNRARKLHAELSSELGFR